MRRWLVLATILVAAAAFFVSTGDVNAISGAVSDDIHYTTPAEMIDAEFLDPHNSPITGEMVQNVWRWYNIPPHILLSIIGAETSMGDPILGGRLISDGHNNFGCLRYGIHPKCDELSNGSVRVAGKDWYSFPTMTAGMMALGRYLKIGPAGNPGYYSRCFRDNRGWYESFAAVYYGRNIPGYWAYVARLKAIDAKLCRVAALYGWLW